MSTPEPVVEVLTALVAEHGAELYTNRRRLEAFLADLCPDDRRAAAVLGVSVRERVPSEIAALGAIGPPDVQRLAARLYESGGIASEFAVWAVRAWAQALGRPAPGAGAPAEAPLPATPAPIAEVEVRALTDHRAAAVDVAFSDDGQVLASCGGDGAARLWSVATGWALHTLRPRRAQVTAVALSPGDQRLATGTERGPVWLWAGDSEVGRLKGHRAGITTVAFDPTGRWLASGDQQGIVRLWQQRGDRVVRELKAHRGAVTAVGFDGAGRRLVTASEDGAALLWDLASVRPIRGLEGHTGAVTAAVLDARGERVVTGGADTTVIVHPVESDTLALHLKVQLPVTALALAPDGVRLAVGTWEPDIQLWDAVSGIALARLSGHTGAISALAASPDGLHLASASADRTVRLWRLL